MKAWRGVPVLVSVLLWGVAGCGGAAMEGVEAEAVLHGVEAKVGGMGGPDKPCGREPRLVRDINPDAASSYPSGLVDVNGLLFFSADDGEHGRELWVSDGDPKHTQLVRDVREPPRAGSVPRFLTRVGNRVFFAADDGVHGVELWRSDGTAAGTVLVKDLRPGAPGSTPEWLTEVGGQLFFVADDGEHGRELWKSDGTAKGTVLVRDFAPGREWFDLAQLRAWDDQLVLVATGADEVVVWATDAKQRELRPLFRGSPDARLSSLVPADHRLFFLVDEGLGEADLWVSWGLAWTTFPLRHFPGDIPSGFTALGREVYFLAGAEGFFGEPGDPEHGGELWKSDGTVRGTSLVKDLRPGPDGSLPMDLVVVDDRLYFSADDGEHGRELWKSDGTARGTVLLSDLEPGPTGSDPQGLTADEDGFFFSAATKEHGREAYFARGSRGSIQRLGDVAEGALPSNPHGFVQSGESVYFVATDGPGEELWALPFRPRNDCAKSDRD